MHCCRRNTLWVSFCPLSSAWELLLPNQCSILISLRHSTVTDGVFGPHYRWHRQHLTHWHGLAPYRGMLQRHSYTPVIIQFLYQPFDSAIKIKEKLICRSRFNGLPEEQTCNMIWTSMDSQKIVSLQLATRGLCIALCSCKHWEDNDNDDDNDEGGMCVPRTWLMSLCSCPSVCFHIPSTVLQEQQHFLKVFRINFWGETSLVFCGDAVTLLSTYLFSQWWGEPEHLWCLHSGPQECVDSYLKVSTLEQARVWFWKAFMWSNIHFHFCYCIIDVTKNATYDLTLKMLTGQNWFLFGPGEHFGCKASLMTVKLHY